MGDGPIAVSERRVKFIEQEDKAPAVEGVVTHFNSQDQLYTVRFDDDSVAPVYSKGVELIPVPFDEQDEEEEPFELHRILEERTRGKKRKAEYLVSWLPTLMSKKEIDEWTELGYTTAEPLRGSSFSSGGERWSTVTWEPTWEEDVDDEALERFRAPTAEPPIASEPAADAKPASDVKPVDEDEATETGELSEEIVSPSEADEADEDAQTVTKAKVQRVI